MSKNKKSIIPIYWSKDILNTFNDLPCNKYSNLLGTQNPFEIKDSFYYIDLNISENYSKKYNFIQYISPAPPDQLTSYTGSGLPFPNLEMAFGNNITKGVVQIIHKTARLSFKYPNNFYINSSKTLLPHHILIRFCDSENNFSKIHAINLDNLIKNRSLKNL